MVLTKEQKHIANQKFYKKHAEKIRESNNNKQTIKYKEDEIFRRIKSTKSNERQYALNAILSIRKLYI